MAKDRGWRGEVSAVLEGTHPRLGRLVPFTLLGLIVFSLASIAIESLPDLPQGLADILSALEVAIVVIFTIEYLLRVIVAERPLRYVFSIFGLIDLFAILPFYLSFGGDFRALRALRLARLFWLFKMARYTTAFANLREAILAVRGELVAFVIIASLLFYACGVAIYVFEHEAQPDVYRSVFDGLWWAVVTMTTVGYGDIYPITAGGRIFTGAILFIGLGIIAVPTGLISSSLTSIREKARASAAAHAPPGSGKAGPGDPEA